MVLIKLDIIRDIWHHKDYHAVILNLFNHVTGNNTYIAEQLQHGSWPIVKPSPHIKNTNSITIANHLFIYELCYMNGRPSFKVKEHYNEE